MTKTKKKLTAGKNLNLLIYCRVVFLGLHKRRPSYRKSLQPSKENIQHFKTGNLSLFSSFVGRICPPRSGSSRPKSMQSGSDHSVVLQKQISCDRRGTAKWTKNVHLVFFFSYRQRILYSGGPCLQMEHRGWQGWVRNSQVRVQLGGSEFPNT
jgi:hypothetical protein